MALSQTLQMVIAGICGGESGYSWNIRSSEGQTLVVPQFATLGCDLLQAGKGYAQRFLLPCTNLGSTWNDVLRGRRGCKLKHTYSEDDYDTAIESAPNFDIVLSFGWRETKQEDLHGNTGSRNVFAIGEFHQCHDLTAWVGR